MMPASDKATRIVLAKVGLDGHDRGIKVVARGLRDAGFHVIYAGLWQSPEAVVRTVADEGADFLGISLLSGAHMTLVPSLLKMLADADLAHVGVIIGGIRTAKLYAVKMQSGFAALDFTSTDNGALTANYVGTSRWTKIGDGIPSKPAVMINPNGNPSVITGTTSQQISSEKVPDPALPQLLGWREVF